MTAPFERPPETRRAYHSGLSGRIIYARNLIRFKNLGVVDRRIRFRTSKYVPPFDVTIRSNVTGWTQDHVGTFNPATRIWEFILPAAQFNGDFEMKFVLDKQFWMIGFDNIKIQALEGTRDFIDSEVLFAYQLEFKTSVWKPNHLVTLRNAIDGWWRDVFGEFRDGQWNFFLDRDVYPATFQAKLVLDQAIFMDGPDLTLAAATPATQLTDANVTFQATPTAYLHGYDNFSAVETPFQQATVRSVGRENDLYDVIIIGSGMGGGTLADALSDRGAKVLVLEAGGLRFPVHMNDLPRSEVNFVGRDELGHFTNLAGSDIKPGVHFSLGGRSVYWSGLIPRMQSWEFRPVWPTEVKDYLTVKDANGVDGYDRAERLVHREVDFSQFQEQVRAHLELALKPDFAVTNLPRSLHQPALAEHKHSTGVFSTADLLLESLGFTDRAGRDNLKVNVHHLVTEIEKSGTKATAVICQDLLGNVQRRFEGKFIVLSCGSFESPKLALNSQLSDPHQKIGKGLTDHPAYFYKIYHELPQTGSLSWIGSPLGHAKIMIRHKQATSWAHPYNIELLINPRYWDPRHADDDLWNNLVAHGGTSKVEIKFIFDSELKDTNSLQSPGPGQKSQVFVAKNDWADGFKAEMVLVRNQVLLAVGVPASELSTTWEPWQWSEGIFGTVHHAGGTLRMSDNQTGVVDKTLKFEAYDNLYCCDVSVFPSIPAANPSLTLVALAQRLAGTLATTLGLP